MIDFLFAFVGYLLLAILIVATLYVLGTYLVLRYDRSLGRAGQVKPSPDEPNHYPRGWRYLSALSEEVLATALFILTFPVGFFWHRPWTQRRNQGRPILLLHGYSHNQSAWVALRLRLRRAGFGPVYSLSLGPTSRSMKKLSQEVDQMAQSIEKETGVKELILVGHSMGGIVAAYYNEELAPHGKVSHLITIGSPLAGSRLATLHANEGMREMWPGSPFCETLRGKIKENHYTRYCQVASRFDNIVYPYHSSLLEGESENQLLLPATGHMGLLLSPQVARQIITWLQATVRRSRQAKKSVPRRPPRPLIAHS